MPLKGSFGKTENEFWYFEVNFGRAVRVRYQLENRSLKLRSAQASAAAWLRCTWNHTAELHIEACSECRTRPCSSLPAAPTAESPGCLDPARSLSICLLFPEREKMTEKPLPLPSNHTHSILWLRGNLEKAFSYFTDNKIFLQIQTTLGKRGHWNPYMWVM